MLKNVTDLAAPDYSKGLNTITNVLALGKNQTPNAMNVNVNFDGAIQKRAGSVTNNSVIIAQSGGSSFTVNSALQLNTGLIAFWQLNEPSGIRYASFSTNNLADPRSVISQSGIRDKAALFIATNSQYLIKESNTQLATGNTNFTISTWFYLTSLNTLNEQTLISKKDGISAYGVDSNCVLLLQMNGVDLSTAITDGSASNHPMTAAGSAMLSVTQTKFGTTALKFSANGDVVSTPSSTDFDFGTGDFTIDGWYFANTGGTRYGCFYDRGETDFRISPQLNDVIPLKGIQVQIEGDTVLDSNSQPVWLESQWQHWALVRSSGVIRFFHNGSSVLGDVASTQNVSNGSSLIIGSSLVGGLRQLRGYLDEIRVLKGRAFWVTSATFPVPTRQWSFATTGSQFEYSLYIDTTNRVSFDVSSSGLAKDITVQNTSFGTVTTATWYNAVAWVDSTNGNVGVSVNLNANSSAYTSGTFSGSAPLVLGSVSNGVEKFLGGALDDTGFWKVKLSSANLINLYNGGSGNTFALGFSSQPWASFDFGAQATRWLTVAAGTGIFASSDLGVNWVTIGTDRSATYQYFERSKNVLVATSELYNSPLAWPGSGGTFMTLFNISAPLAKYTVNFQGFCILLNTSTRKRGFFYQDENTQLTGAWANSFDLPSSADDEITGAFILRRYLYVSTRYSLFRVSYVGGNPDWSFQLVKSFGFVPRTVQKVTLGQVGEVAIGEDFDRRIRVFDGADDKIISSDVEDDNGMCDFATSKVSYGGSGLITHFSALDPTAYVYKLAVGIGTNSTDVTHWLNFDSRISAFYPYSNMLFSTMTVAESGGQRYLMAFDKSGFCHLTDSGNLDSGVTPIDDVFDSPFLFDKSPSNISKSHKLDLYFRPTSSGTIYFSDRTNFSKTFKLRDKFDITDDGSLVLYKKSIDTPTSFNAYQFSITSSRGTAQGWELTRNDNFIVGLGIGGFNQ